MIKMECTLDVPVPFKLEEGYIAFSDLRKYVMSFNALQKLERNGWDIHLRGVKTTVKSDEQGVPSVYVAIVNIIVKKVIDEDGNAVYLSDEDLDQIILLNEEEAAKLVSESLLSFIQSGDMEIEMSQQQINNLVDFSK